MGMVGLRDMFVVAPASTCNHHHPHDSIHLANEPIDGPNSSSTALGVGVGVGVNVIPLLAAAPCLAPQNTDDQDLLNNGRNKFSGIQFWENQASNTGHCNDVKRAATASVLDHHNNPSANLLQTANSTGGGLSGPVTCQDCGNQAKKDCSHRRCRTCCKSRGFDCATHVKSTWLPAARRRERQLMTAAGAGEGGAAAGSSGSTSGPKKPRLIASQTTTTSHTSTSNNTPPRSFDTSSSHQDASFKDNLPGQVSVPAVFRCVRLAAVDDGEDEVAYQAVVKIGGHVFKGVLLDQGAETRDGFPNLSELHLGGASGSGGAGGRNVVGGASSSSPIFDPSSVVYGSSGGWLLGGSSYAATVGNASTPIGVLYLHAFRSPYIWIP